MLRPLIALVTLALLSPTGGRAETPREAKGKANGPQEGVGVGSDAQPSVATGVEGSTLSDPGADGLRLPVTFRGKLPCADCAAIRYHLDLWRDGVFHLRREWVGGRDHRDDFRADDIGRWHVDSARNVLILHGVAGMPLQFEITGPDRLLALDIQGKPIQSDLPYELRSHGTLKPTDLTLLLSGELVYNGDSARFTECLTGRSYPVAIEGEFPELKSAYLHAQKMPGAPLYVTFQGTLTDHLMAGGAGSERVVVVNRFIDARPGQSCNQAGSSPSSGDLIGQPR
jgi:copper homeostasis protein (lipoprotein)